VWTVVEFSSNLKNIGYVVTVVVDEALCVVLDVPSYELLWELAKMKLPISSPKTPPQACMFNVLRLCISDLGLVHLSYKPYFFSQ
jgi:hypothetical protein